MIVKVPDMTCRHCEEKIAKALNELELNDFMVNLDTKEIVIDLANVSKINVIEAIEKAGYTVEK